MKRNIVRILLIGMILGSILGLTACKPKPNNGVTDVTVEFINQ